MQVDIPVYMNKGNNRLRLRVYARGDAKELPVKVYWDDVKLKALSELVKSEERGGYGDVRMEKVR